MDKIKYVAFLGTSGQYFKYLDFKKVHLMLYDNYWIIRTDIVQMPKIIIISETICKISVPEYPLPLKFSYEIILNTLFITIL